MFQVPLRVFSKKSTKIINSHCQKIHRRKFLNVLFNPQDQLQVIIYDSSQIFNVDETEIIVHHKTIVFTVKNEEASAHTVIRRT